MDKLNEPKWKNDLVKIVWTYARSSGLVIVDPSKTDAGHERLPEELSDLVFNIRARCDRCGMPRARLSAEGIAAHAIRTLKNTRFSWPLFDELSTVLKDVLGRHGLGGVEIDPYQCCRVMNVTEDYCPNLCVPCHQELQRQRPHSTISV